MLIRIASQNWCMNNITLLCFFRSPSLVPKFTPFCLLPLEKNLSFFGWVLGRNRGFLVFSSFFSSSFFSWILLFLLGRKRVYLVFLLKSSFYKFSPLVGRQSPFFLLCYYFDTKLRKILATPLTKVAPLKEITHNASPPPPPIPANTPNSSQTLRYWVYIKYCVFP